MLIEDFGFCGGTYLGYVTQWASDRCVNMYPQPATPDGKPKTQIQLINRPGLTLFGTINSPVRALWAGNSRLFAAGGTHFYEINNVGGVITDFGVMAGSLGTASPCQVVSNANQLLVMDSTVNNGGQLFGDVFNAAGGVMTEVFKGSSLTYVDGFFVGLSSNAGDVNKVFVSNYLDGTVWNALNFVQRTGAPDLLLQLTELNGQLWMFGEKTIEVWYNAGNPTFPFARIPGATINVGLMQRWSLVKFPNQLMWIGGSDTGQPRVYMTKGIQPVAVSPSGINYILNLFAGGSITAATCYGYEENGHQFYCINLPTATNYNLDTGLTLVYDLTTGYWHERNTWSGTVAGQFLPQCAASVPSFSGAGAYVFAGDYSSGKIYKQSVNFTSDNAAAIQYVRIAPHVSDGNRWWRYGSLEIDASIGSAQMTLDYSNNGGTFPAAHRRGPVSASNTQAYPAGDGFGRFKFWQLGRSRSRSFKMTITDAANHIRIIGAYLNASSGAEPMTAAEQRTARYANQ